QAGLDPVAGERSRAEKDQEEKGGEEVGHSCLYPRPSQACHVGFCGRVRRSAGGRGPMPMKGRARTAGKLRWRGKRTRLGAGRSTMAILGVAATSAGDATLAGKRRVEAMRG